MPAAPDLDNCLAVQIKGSIKERVGTVLVLPPLSGQMEHKMTTGRWQFQGSRSRLRLNALGAVSKAWNHSLARPDDQLVRGCYRRIKEEIDFYRIKLLIITT